jgi:hypothetical protein
MSDNTDDMNDFVLLAMARDEAVSRVKELEAKLAKAVEALDEAVYLLAPDDKDMARKAGVYRIVTTFAALKGQDDE